MCKDGISCIGFASCKKATIKSVVESCNGDLACNRAGGNKNGRYEGEPNEGEYEGYIGIVTKSCIGTQACEKAADGGYIGSITKSCHGEKSCRFAGELGPKENEKFGFGSITNITKSCDGTKSCYFAGYDGTIEGGGIYKSCFGENSCYGAGSYGGVIGGVGIYKSCNGTNACYYTSGQNIDQGFETCCNEAFSCEFASSQTDLPDDCVAKVPKGKGKGQG